MAIANQHLRNADDLQANGQVAKAIQVIEDLLERFAGDADLTKLLDHWRPRQREADEIADVIIPNLAAENQWCSIRDRLRQLESLNVQMPGLGSCREQADKRIAAVDQQLLRIESLLESGKVTEARREAERALQVVSDHPRVLEVARAAGQSADHLIDLHQKVQTALQSRRWFEVRRLLGNDTPSQTTFIKAREKASHQIKAANEFTRLLAWALAAASVASLTILAAATFAGGLKDQAGDIEWLPSRLIEGLLSIGTACGAIWLLRQLIGRPVAAWYPIVWAVTWLFGFILVLFGAPAILDASEAPWLAQAFSILGYAATVSMVFCLMTSDLTRPPVRSIASMFGWLLVGLVIADYATALERHWARFVVPSIWAGSWLIVLNRLHDRWRIGVLIVASLMAGILAAGLDREPYDDGWLAEGMVATAALSIAGWSVGAQRTIRGGLLTVMIVGPCVVANEYFGHLRLLTVWWLATAYLIYQNRHSLDFRLHWLDRLRDWFPSKTTKNSNSPELATPFPAEIDR